MLIHVDGKLPYYIVVTLYFASIFLDFKICNVNTLMTDDPINTSDISHGFMKS